MKILGLCAAIVLLLLVPETSPRAQEIPARGWRLWIGRHLIGAKLDCGARETLGLQPLVMHREGGRGVNISRVGRITSSQGNAAYDRYCLSLLREESAAD